MKEAVKEKNEIKVDNIKIKKIKKIYIKPSIKNLGRVKYVITMCSGNTCNGKSHSLF